VAVKLLFRSGKGRTLSGFEKEELGRIFGRER
jgi:hypothetical protein